MNPNFIQEPIDMSPTFLSSSPVKNEKLKASYAFVTEEYPRVHGHSNFCEILFIYKGTINNFINGKWRSMSTGDCCLIQKGDIHRVVCSNEDATDKKFLGVNLIIREDYFEKLKLLCDDEVADEVFGPTEEQKIFHINEQEATSIYNKLLASQSFVGDDVREFELTTKLIIVKLLLRYIEQFYNVEDGFIPAWLLQLLADIQNPANMAKSLTEYIENIPYSYSYIAKEFKKYMDCPMINHITAVKLNYAMELLENTTLSSLDICAKIGYNSLSHYNYVFKKNFGQTPSYYRKRKKSGGKPKQKTSTSNLPNSTYPKTALADMAARDTKFDIIVVAGQSNAAGTGIGETDCPYVPTEKVMMLVGDTHPYFDNNSEGAYTLFINADAPLQIYTADERFNADGVRLGQFQLSFAKEYYEKYLKDSDRKVLIVQAAVGGTCFARNEWGTEGAVLYDRLIKMTQYALSLNSENRLVAFLWHQGESDTYERPELELQERYEVHKKNLSAMIAAFCDNFECREIPIIAAGFVDEWYQKFKEPADAVYAAIKEVFAQYNSVFLDTSMLKSNNQQTGNGDDIHFCRDALQRLGRLYFDGFVKLTSKK